MKPKISFSIADIPLGISIRESFELAKNLKVDGVEIVIFAQTRFYQNDITALSNEYKIPILSIHQPPWSYYGIYHEENMFEFAAKHNASINAHPLKDPDILGKTAGRYFSWLSRNSNKYKVPVMIENMPLSKKYIPYLSVLFLSSFNPTTSDFRKISEVCETYKFGFTLDTDHLQISSPGEYKDFEIIYPYMQSVHLSSFDSSGEHLPLDVGNLKSREFLQELKKRNYSNLITLELTPHYFYDKKKYFEDIKRSISIVQEIF